MLTDEMRHLLESATGEIYALRRERDILRGQVDVIELMRHVAFAERPSRGMAQDVAWSIQNVLANDLTARIKERDEKVGQMAAGAHPKAQTDQPGYGLM